MKKMTISLLFLMFTASSYSGNCFSVTIDKSSENSRLISQLPPEPGPENNRTLAGVDSDGDGVRDDIQRYILLNYEDDEAMRLVLLQTANVNQLKLTQAHDKEASRMNAIRSLRAIECSMYIGGEEAFKDTNKVTAMQINTRERSKAYDLFHQQIAGAITMGKSYKEYYKSCTFDVRTVMGRK